MAKLLDLIQSASKPLLWLDDTAYVERLLANGNTPWLAPADYVALRRKAAGLLSFDVCVVPLLPIAEASVGANSALAEAMAAKKRAVVPARTLLADEGLRAHLVELLQGLRAAFSSMPLVLQLPSPRVLVAAAYRLAHGADASVEVGEDEADSCAVYLAEFLRTFGELGLDGLVLTEEADAEPASVDELEWYQPVVNVAMHYRWDLGVLLPSGQALASGIPEFQFAIAPTRIEGVVQGTVLEEAFWNGGDAAAVEAGGFRFSKIPAEAVPETVLERLGSLR